MPDDGFNQRVYLAGIHPGALIESNADLDPLGGSNFARSAKDKIVVSVSRILSWMPRTSPGLTENFPRNFSHSINHRETESDRAELAVSSNELPIRLYASADNCLIFAEIQVASDPLQTILLRERWSRLRLGFQPNGSSINRRQQQARATRNPCSSSLFLRQRF